MITQKDIHNHIVKNATPAQKAYISMQCGGDPEKIKEVEQGISNLINGVIKTINNAGTDYLNKALQEGEG